MKKIIISAIGEIRTSYKNFDGIPIQSRFHEREIGRVLLLKRYQPGLKDLTGFSHVILLYHLNRAIKEQALVQPLLEKSIRGVFATRSPFRPNHIGLAIVKLKKIYPDGFEFYGVDMIDQTPLLDIKPYISHLDSFKNVRNGWFQRHLRDGKIPRRARLGKNHLIGK